MSERMTLPRRNLRIAAIGDLHVSKSSQGVFTDWLAGSILIMVDEAKDTADASRWSERRAVYERLKAIIDPKACAFRR